MEDDGLLSIRTDRDDRDGYSDLPFDEGDVVLQSLREVLGISELGGIALPALEFTIYRMDVLRQLVGEVTCLLVSDLIVGTDTDGLKGVEHVALHHDQTSDPAEHHRVAKGYEVEPATATTTARDGAKFMT